MPMYEYLCNSCGEQFEELVSLSSHDEPPCPQCSSIDTRKLVSLFGGVGMGGAGGSSCGTSGFS